MDRARPGLRPHRSARRGPWGWGVLALALLPVVVAAGFLSSPASLGALSASLSSALGGAPANSAGGSGTHYVPSVLSGLSLASYLGPAPATHDLTIGVSAQRPDPAAVNAAERAIYDPSSPNYHHFLTPAQFDQRFGLSSSAVSAIEQWLSSAGLRVDTAAADGSYYTATGTVAELEQLFDVKIGSYRSQGLTFLANDVPPSVPKDLPVDDVLGLDTVNKFAPAPLTGTVSNVPSLPAQGPQSGTQETLTPQDLWGVYDDPGGDGANVTAHLNGTWVPVTNPTTGVSNPAALQAVNVDYGQGQTIGIFGEGETSSIIDNLRLFESTTGLPKVPVRTVYTEGPTTCTAGPPNCPGYGDNTPTVEWYLDTQASTGMAPDVSQLDLYFAKNLYDADVFQDFSYWANDPSGPKEMNASFGECEANPTDPVTGPLAEVPYGTEYGNELQGVGEPILEQAAAEGRTLFSSAGDTGSGCPEVVVPVGGAGNGVAIQPIPDVSFPCSSNYVVCVGGTVVSVNGAKYPQSAQRDAETSWTFSGGGSSFFQPEPGTSSQPEFQSDVANVNMPCLTSAQGDPYPVGSEPTCRGVPDVSDMSGNVTGDEYFYVNDAEPSAEGGTSLSSPLMMGQWARVQAAASKTVQGHGGLGFADYTIYDQASSADSCSSSPMASAAQTAACTSTPYAQDFTDITESEYGIGNGVYQPGPGWDYASGWGPLNVADFIADVDCSGQSDRCAPAPGGALYSLGAWNHGAGNYTGTILANAAYGGPETGSFVATLATLYGTPGWSTDPIDSSALIGDPSDQAPNGPPVVLPADNGTPNYDPSLDITGATLQATASTVTATITGPDLEGLPPPTAGGGGDSFFVAWRFNNTVYYATAMESALSGSWSYSSGSTAGGGYNNTSNSAATGSLTVGTDSATLTIQVPTSEVGSPPAGALLADPQSLSTLDVGTPAAWLYEPTDTADDLVPWQQLQSSTDCAYPKGRTENPTGTNAEAGQQVALCSLDESKGVEVKVQPAPSSSSGTVSASVSSPLPSITVGPVTLTLPNPGGAGTPATPLLPPLISLGSAARTTASKPGARQR